VGHDSGTPGDGVGLRTRVQDALQSGHRRRARRATSRARSSA
jgi:hypothetical protein